MGLKNILKSAMACVAIFSTTNLLEASVTHLSANPMYIFASGHPQNWEIASAISQRWGKPVSITNRTLPLANTSYAPVLGNPIYTYGPSASGVIQNLQLGSSLITGITKGILKSNGTHTVGGVTFSRYILRVFTATQFHDVDVTINAFSGTPQSFGAAYAFTKISSPRPITLLP